VFDIQPVLAALLGSCILLSATATATSQVVAYSNFGPGDSFKNSVHDVLNQHGYLEHAARFLVPAGPDLAFASVDLPISDSLIENEGLESQLSVRLWSDDQGQPGTILESIVTDVIARPPNALVQRVQSSARTTLRQGTPYWISLAAINPGRVNWFVNSTETGGYALNDPVRGIPWLVIDSAEAGAFRVFGEVIPEPSTGLLLSCGLTLLAAVGSWRGVFVFRKGFYAHTRIAFGAMQRCR
jgi:hypothetical protein